MPELQLRKDTDDGVVEVNTGDGWRKLSPDAARDMATTYDEAADRGDFTEADINEFTTKLRDYADDIENQQ